MQTIFVSGNDTDAGKTHVLGQVAGTLAARGLAVQIVKFVETGMPRDDSPGDADRALAAAREIARGAGTLAAFRLARYSQPLAPTEAARRDGDVFSVEETAEKLRALPPCDVRLVEGAGGLGVPVGDAGTDWADFARERADATLIVIENRLGAISQARFLAAYCAAKGVPAPHFWLNEIRPQSEGVLASNALEIPKTGVPVVGRSAPGGEFSAGGLDALLCAGTPRADTGAPVAAAPETDSPRFAFFREKLAAVAAQGRERVLAAVPARADFVDLSANDYLSLARDAAVKAGAIRAVGAWGASSSASPLITGYREIHAELERELCAWLGFRCGLVWNTGYAANCCVLGTLPQAGDRIFADRLIHNSMIAGILKSGARFQRYRHNDAAHLRELLEKTRAEGFAGTTFVATESVFSMDGDYPDLAAMARLREEFGFVWIVDEAHATGWFGKNGGGLIDALGLAGEVDVLVGTLGKSLGAAGAYTLFNDETLRRYLVNFGAEFIFSTYLPPAAVGAALAAVRRVRDFSEEERAAMPALSRRWRARLREIAPGVPDGDSPVVPVPVGAETETMRVAARLRERGFRVGAIRPPTVPAGTSRLRLSLNRTLTDAQLERFAEALREALASRNEQ
ncbi:aminotransferase class I/II-fold pyridoxal phosphate-dependent enzyme [Candidatus Spyradosoma sp. SGI.093]|uniref:aminotransferase class I/II-fold pyridoxal phosphate-dependent enzyme n=1 Tax=Candidatus Spyradosoma sp. SGI.093 TaxID=3420583 RepID=UPI003CFC6A95